MQWSCGAACGWVFGILAFGVMVSAGGLTMFWLVMSRQPSVPERSTLVVRVQGELVEGGPEDVFSQFLPGQRPPSVSAIVENIRKAKSTLACPRSLLVRPAVIENAFWGNCRRSTRPSSISSARAKRLSRTLEDGRQKEYYLATACDRIY